MTLLKENMLTGDIRAKLYEAPFHESCQIDRIGWVYNAKPFFEKEIHDFWKIYCTPFSTVDMAILPECAEVEERRRFIKKPMIVAEKYDEVVGGVWLDNTVLKRDYKGNQFHIKLERECREAAYPLMDMLTCEFSHLYDFLICSWGEREKKDDPSRFFRNNNFEVVHDYHGGKAYLQLR